MLIGEAGTCECDEALSKAESLSLSDLRHELKEEVKERGESKVKMEECGFCGCVEYVVKKFCKDCGAEWGKNLKGGDRNG